MAKGTWKSSPDADQVRSFMEGPAPGVLIAQQRYAAGLPAEITAGLQRLQSLREDMRPWESKSSKREKWVAWFWTAPVDVDDATGATKGADDAK